MVQTQRRSLGSAIFHSTAMALRTAHGSARARGNTVVVETLPADELPFPSQVDPKALPAPVERREDGTFADPTAAQLAGRKGGLAKAYKRKGLEGLGLIELGAEKDMYKYWKAAGAYMSAIKNEYAAASGGILGAAGSSILGNSAILLAAIKFYGDQALLADKDPKERDRCFTRAATLMNQHKGLLLTAMELSMRIGAANGTSKPVDPFAIIARVQDENGFVISEVLDQIPDDAIDAS